MNLIPLYGHGWESNSYLLIENGEAALIDAGLSPHELLTQLEEQHATLRYILLTHGHFDHTVAVDMLREKTGAQLIIHEADAEMLTDSEKSALYYFFGTRTAHKPADRTVVHGDIIPFGNTQFRVFHTPGHSLGSSCYQIDNMLFSGDTLFDRGYGRYDLYGGNEGLLMRSLQALQHMDPSLELHPGHGGPSTLGTALEQLFGAT